MSEWYTVARASDIPVGTAAVVSAAKKQIALCNVDGEFFAVDDLCTHDYGPLGEGELVDDRIECPRHGALFDVRTGRAVTPPAVQPVATYPVRVQGEEIQVAIE
jgi:3-phenylpropionate/trans-cinnamate dioxygenase ferredoxin subunit